MRHMAPVDDAQFAPIAKPARPSRKARRSFKLGADEAEALRGIMSAAGITNESEGIRTAIRVAAAFVDGRDEAWVKSSYREGFIAGLAEFKCQFEIASKTTMEKLKAHK